MNADIEKACATVFEKVTGKCWHTLVKWNSQCWKCLECDKYVRMRNVNPKLVTSLDAWREIWDAMTDEQKYLNAHCIANTATRETLWAWELTPLHHLEAALRMLGENELAEKVKDHD